MDMLIDLLSKYPSNLRHGYLVGKPIGLFMDASHTWAPWSSLRRLTQICQKAHFLFGLGEPSSFRLNSCPSYSTQATPGNSVCYKWKSIYRTKSLGLFVLSKLVRRQPMKIFVPVGIMEASFVFLSPTLVHVVLIVFLMM